MPPSGNARHLVPAIEGALTQAGNSLSRLIESGCTPHGSTILLRPLDKLPTLLGSEDELVTAVIFEVRKDLTGFLLIVIPQESAMWLLQHLLGSERDAVMDNSTLGEVGNIVGSAFLNHLADRFVLRAAPTPPQVVHDMAGALLSTAGTYLAADGQDEFPVVQTELSEESGRFTAYLLWLPVPGTGRGLEETL